MQLIISQGTKIAMCQFSVEGDKRGGVFAQTSRMERVYIPAGAFLVEEVEVRLREGELASWIVVTSLLRKNGMVFGEKAEAIKYWANLLTSRGVRLHPDTPIANFAYQTPLFSEV